jgi:hypothetical protein
MTWAAEPYQKILSEHYEEYAATKDKVERTKILSTICIDLRHAQQERKERQVTDYPLDNNDEQLEKV